MRVDTLVIGAGQAGLAVSHHLAALGEEHLIVERDAIGASWTSGVWDSFRLVTPNWTVQLPGFAYAGPDPDGFLAREEIVDYLHRYAGEGEPPLRTGVEVLAVERNAGDDGFAVATSAGAIDARCVVVATGGYHAPALPPAAADLGGGVQQIHSSRYRRQAGLPDGAVLVVGAGQSGAQIADELYRSGRQVYLSVGRCRRGPRRYRGRDVVWWLERMGWLDRTPAAADASVSNLQLSGADGGRDLDLHRFAADGVVLVGRLLGGAGGRLRFGDDLARNLEIAEAAATRIRESIDRFVARTGMAAPEAAPDEPIGAGTTLLEPLRELDLRAAGISTVVWATGYRPDFGWIRLPIFRADGYPTHTRGVTPVPGLYFLGLRHLHKVKSELLLGVGEDAAHVAAQIANR